MPRVSMSALEQGVDYPEWANEQTLQELVEAIKGVRSTSVDEGNQTQQAITKGTRATVQAIKSGGAFGGGLNPANWISGFGKLITGATGQLGKLIRNLDKVDGSFKSLSGIVSDGTGIFATAMTMMDGYVRRVRDLSNVGLGLSGEMTRIAGAAASSRLTIDAFNSILIENGITIRNLGDSAIESAQRFGALSEELTINLAQMGMYGMRQEELNDLLVGQLEIQRMQGIQGDLAANRARDAILAMADEATAMAQITGRDRREILLAQQQAGSGVPLQTYLAQIQAQGGDTAAVQRRQQELVGILTSQFGEDGTEIANQITQMVTTGLGLAGSSEDMKQLVAATDVTMEGLEQMMQYIKDGTGTSALASARRFNEEIKSGRESEYYIQQSMFNDGIKLHMKLGTVQRAVNEEELAAIRARIKEGDTVTKMALGAESAIKGTVSTLKAMGFETAETLTSMLQDIGKETGLTEQAVLDYLIKTPNRMKGLADDFFGASGMDLNTQLRAQAQSLGESEFIQMLFKSKSTNGVGIAPTATVSGTGTENQVALSDNTSALLKLNENFSNFLGRLGRDIEALTGGIKEQVKAAIETTSTVQENTRLQRSNAQQDRALRDYFSN